MALVNGDVIDASVFTGLVPVTGEAFHLNGGLDASKAVSPAAHDVYVASDTGVVYVCYVAGTWARMGPGVVDRVMSDVTVGNTANKTTLYTFNLAAGALGTISGLRGLVRGTCKQNQGGAQTLEAEVKIGTTVVADTVPSIGNSATVGVFEIDFLVWNLTAASQRGYVRCSVLRDGVAISGSGAYGTASENTAGLLAITLSVKWQTADANMTLTRKIATTELLP